MKTPISIKCLLFICVLFIFPKSSNAQYYNPGTGDTTIYQIYTHFFNSIDSSQIKADTVEDSQIADFMKWYNFWEPRLAPSGNFNVAAQAWSAYSQDFHNNNSHSLFRFCNGSSPLPNIWTELGVNVHTGNHSGQVHSITFDPSNSNIMYAGGMDGGVCRSIDGGNNWVKMGTDNQLLSLGVSDIAVEPTYTNVVYVASGDEQSRLAFTDGVYRTIDANDGSSAVWKWQNGPISLSNYYNQQFIHQLAIDPNDNTLLYAAVDDPDGHHNGGVWYANNRDQWNTQLLNWNKAPGWGFPYASAYSDAAFSVVTKSVGNQTILLAAGYDIFWGTISSSNWTSITGPNSGTNGLGSGLDLSPVPLSPKVPFQLNASYFYGQYLNKITLTLSNDGNYLYAYIWTFDNNGQYSYVARYNFLLGGWDISPNNLIAGNLVSQSPPTCAGNGIGRDALAIDPNNSDRIFVGTTELVESINGGQNWYDDYGYCGFAYGPHTDYHAIKFQPGNSYKIYLGTDGGLSSNISTGIPLSNLNSTFTDLNYGLGFSLDCGVQSSEQDAGDVWQTMQDNSANHLLHSTYSNFIGNLGDGDNTLIDYLNNKNVYLASSYNSIGLQYTNNGYFPNPSFHTVGKNFYSMSNNPGDPIILNPFNPNTLFEGKADILKGNDAELEQNCVSSFPNCWQSWSDFTNQISPYSHVVLAMTIAPTDSNYLYASLYSASPDYFRLVWSADANGVGTGGGTAPGAWTDATPDTYNYTITGIAVSYLDKFHVWVCYSGYDPGHKVMEGQYNPISKQWQWSNADPSYSLCNFPINCIAYENGSNDGLYIGTDAGVYYKNASMTKWERVGNDFPNVIVRTLNINYCSKKLVVGTYGRGAWETDLVPSTSTPLQITSNYTLTAAPSQTSIMIPGDVEIQSPNTLTISAGTTINMSSNHKIIVDPGATLIVNGTITNACNQWWSGIELQGSSLSPQTSGIQGTVILNPGSEIENAVNGIRTGKWTSNVYVPGFTGGIIQANGIPGNGVTFHNNQCDVQFLSYPYPNHSLFNFCTFETDISYPNYASTILQPRVNMWAVHGVTFWNNTFEDLIPVANQPYSNYRGTGIYSHDASYLVNNCSVKDVSNGCCVGGPNYFTRLGYGIKAANSNPTYTVDIIGNTFTDNYYDIDIANINNMYIQNNTFSKTTNEGQPLYCINCHPYNLYLDGCTGYNVSGNNFTNTHYSNSYGTIVYNSGKTNNMIYGNAFSGIYVQSQSEGTNGKAQRIFIWPFGWFYFYSGLQYKCNNYNSNITNGADISVATGLIDPIQGNCTNYTTTANNTFNNACSSNRNNIYTYSGLPPADKIIYSAPNVPGSIPFCTHIPFVTVQVNNCTNVTSLYCTPNCGPNINGVSLRNRRQEYKHKRDSLRGILAAGTAPNLFAAIASQSIPPAAIQDTLLIPGPYLSDSVLGTAATGNLPAQNLANVLIPNATLDSSIVSTLDSIALPDTIVNQINAFQNDSTLSQRYELQMSIAYYQGQMDETTDELIRLFERDTTTGSLDSAQAVILSDSLTTDRLAQLASLQMAKGQDSAAVITLDSLHSRDVDSMYNNYCRLLPILINLNNDSLGELSLIGNTEDSAILEQIAMDTLRPGYANARAVLNFVYNQQIFEPITPLENNDAPHRLRKNNNLKIHSKQSTKNSNIATNKFNLFPNPANDKLTIQYTLDKNVQSASVELFDEIGNKVATWQLLPSQNTLNENIVNRQHKVD